MRDTAATAPPEELTDATTNRLLRNRKQRPQPGHRPADPVRGGPLPLADLLDLRRRAPTDRRSDARGLCHAGLAVPLRGDDRLHDPAPAGVPGGRARARTGPAGRRSAAARSRPRPLPALRLPHRARFRALPELFAKAQGALHQLLASARSRLDDLSLLRDRGAGRSQAGAHVATRPSLECPPCEWRGRERGRLARAGGDRRGPLASG